MEDDRFPTGDIVAMGASCTTTGGVTAVEGPIDAMCTMGLAECEVFAAAWRAMGLETMSLGNVSSAGLATPTTVVDAMEGPTSMDNDRGPLKG